MLLVQVFAVSSETKVCEKGKLQEIRHQTLKKTQTKQLFALAV